MNYTHPEPDAGDIQVLVGQLCAAVRTADTDDLTMLAKMHGWCESLADVAGCAAGPRSPSMAQRCTSLARALEGLILGEAEDAPEVLASITEGVSELVKLVESDAGSFAPAAGSADPDADPSAADVAARLGKVFEEEPGEARSTAATAAETAEAAVWAEMPSDVEAPAARAAAGGEECAEVPPPDEPPYESVPLKIGKKELEFVKGFVEEANEHVQAIEAALLEVEREPDKLEKVNDLFRPFHTIKSMAGFLNLRDVNCLAHEAETLLDQARKGRRAITPGMIDVIFAVADILKAQIAAIGSWVADPRGDTVPQPPVAEMIDKLRAVVAGRVALDARPTPAEHRMAAEREAMPATLPASQAAPPPTAPAGPRTIGDQSIRIDTEKLDALVDMVGELLIAQTLVHANPQIAGDPRLGKDVSQVSKIVRDVQAVAMAMRMVPIGPTFQKMARLVRDVSRKAGKQVELTMAGEDTELDKNVIQQIGDPLVHMVRNAVDHGIEPPKVRQALGKPEVGHVHLSARHQGGSIVIEISDDGKGLDLAVLVAKGIEKGIVQPGEELTEQRAFALIFAPGLSTAEKITGISGRGVGMDVAKRNIDQLRGRIEIVSEKGRGSTFSIRLPLTLAIIDGMVVRAGRERFIIPTITIEQSLRPLPRQITTVQHKGEVLNVRGRLIPLLQLGELLELTGRIDPCDAMVVVIQSQDWRVGIVVEELIGQQQVVIKTLGERFRKLRGVSGAAILGDGRVGLILETTGLAVLHQSRTGRSTRSGPTRDSGHVVERPGSAGDEPAPAGTRTGREAALT